MKNYELYSGGVLIKTGHDQEVLTRWAQNNCSDWELYIVHASKFPMPGRLRLTIDDMHKAQRLASTGLPYTKIGEIMNISDVSAAKLVRGEILYNYATPLQ